MPSASARSSAFLPGLLAVALGAAAFMGPSVAHAQTTKIGIIDVRRAISETEEGLRLQAKLKKIFESRQVDIEAKTRLLQTDKEALEKEAQRPGADKAALTKKYEKLVQLDAEIQRAQVEAQREMGRKEQELTAPIYAGILEAVKRIAADKGFEMVLEKSAVPFFRGDLDLTDLAIQMYNGGQPRSPKGATPPPGKPTTPPAPPKK